MEGHRRNPPPRLATDREVDDTVARVILGEKVYESPGLRIHKWT